MPQGVDLPPLQGGIARGEWRVSEVRNLCSDRFRELRIRNDTSKSMIPVWFRLRSSPEEPAAKVNGTSEPRHELARGDNARAGGGKITATGLRRPASQKDAAPVRRGD
jgi:hypothetical protein